MARRSRRDDLLVVALRAFQDSGFQGTSIADIVDALGMTKAAFGYHLDSKEQLLVELVEPLLEDIDEVLDRFPAQPAWPDEGHRLLSDYLDVLIAHRDVVVWIDGDKAVLRHPTIGKRLAESNTRLRTAISGDDPSPASRLGASATLGALWRPLRNLTDLEVRPEREAILAAALAVAGTTRPATTPTRAKRRAKAQRRTRQKAVLGWREWLSLPDLSPSPVKAKIDTGARTSTLHAFGLSQHQRDGAPWVSFEVHPVQRSRLQATAVSYPVKGFRRVRSSSGHSELRPVIRTPVQIGDHNFDIDVTLTSRDEMGFRMLLGRAAVRRRFLVDAGRSFVQPLPRDAPHPERKEDGT